MLKKEEKMIDTICEEKVNLVTPETELEVEPESPTKTKKTTRRVKSETSKKTTSKTAKAPKEVIKEIVKIVTPEIYLQFAGLEFNSSGILNQAREAWIATGHDEHDIESLKVYIKPEDAAVYYVINETETGKFDLSI